MVKSLIEYLPCELREIREFIELFSALEPEVFFIQEEIERWYKNQFIKTADEEGVLRLEKIYGIKPKLNDTLETRKFKLLTRSIGILPATEVNLKNMLNILCGQDNFEFYINYEEFFIKIRVALAKKENFSDVSEVCRKTIPANMAVDLSLMFTQNQNISGCTHGFLSGYTHKEIKETEDF